MPKSPIRLIAALLIPCLLADPSLAAASPQQQRVVGREVPFAQQAIVPAIRLVHAAYGKGTFRQLQITATLLIAVLAAGGWNTVHAQTSLVNRDSRATTREEERELKEMVRKIPEDLSELPPQLSSEYQARLIKAFHSTKSNENGQDAVMDVDSEEMLPSIMAATQPLLADNYFVSLTSEKDTERATLFHLSPQREFRMFGGKKIAIYHITRISGYTKGIPRGIGYSLFGLPDTTFLNDGLIHKFAKEITSVLHAHRTGEKHIRWNILKKHIDLIDDSLAQEIVLERYQDIPEDQIESAFIEQVLLHEFMHNWLMPRHDNAEEIAYLGALVFSKSPYYDLLRMGGILHRAEKLKHPEDDERYHETFSGIDWVFSELGDELMREGLLTSEDVKKVLTHEEMPDRPYDLRLDYEKLLSGKQIMDFIRLLREKNISADALRGAARTIYNKDYGDLPPLNDGAFSSDHKTITPRLSRTAA